MPRNPIESVRRVNKGTPKQMSTAGNKPSYAQRSFGEVDKDNLRGFAPDPESENAFLKRLARRQQITGQSMAAYVPPASDLELEVGKQMAQLNTLNSNGNAADHLKILLLQSKFGTTNLYNIAQKLGELKLERQSMKVIEALVDKGVDGFADALQGAGTDDAGVGARQAARAAREVEATQYRTATNNMGSYFARWGSV